MIKNRPYPYYEVPEISNLKQYLEKCEKQYKNRTAISFYKDKNFIKKSFKDFNKDIKYLSNYILNLNYRKEKIAVLGENSYEWLLVYFSATTSGNIIVPIDKMLSVDEIEHILIETETKVLFYSNQYSDYIDKIKLKVNNINFIDVNKIDEMIKKGKNEKDLYDSAKIDSQDLAAIIYTSGTTGIAKGVMLTHKNICADYIGGRKNLKTWGRSILLLPLNHTFALTGAVLCPMGDGVEIYINQNLKNFMNDIKAQKPDVMLVVPMMLEMFYKKIWMTAKNNKKDKILKIMIVISNLLLKLGIDKRRKIFKSVLEAFGGNLEILICGGAPLEKKYIKDFRSFGIQVIQGYGITECSPIVSTTRNYYYKDDAVGLKLPNVDVKIDKFNNSDEGEILVKGECVMKGYYKKPELTKECFDEDGYFKTGDIGRLDEDGFVYITGRKKNMIILENGKNIYPEELEFELQKNKTIKEVLVYEDNGKIIAEVFPNKEKLEILKIDNIQEYYKKYLEEINKKLPLYKNISDIKIREVEFPKTTSMKIKRVYKN